MPDTDRLATNGTAREIGARLGDAPALSGAVLQGGTRLTERWSHAEVHADFPGLPSYVLATYYSPPQRIAWKSGREELSSHTGPEAFTLMPAGSDGRCDTTGAMTVSHLYLSPERLRSSTREYTRGRPVEIRPRVAFVDPIASQLLKWLAREAPSSDPASHLFAEQTIELLCVQIARSHSIFGSTSPMVRGGLTPRQVRLIADHMRANLTNGVSLDGMARLIGLSRFHFCTAFRQTVGQSPYDRYIGLRLEWAKELLGDRRLTITDVALTTGYGTSSAFSAAFRSGCGMTPSDFRRAL